MSDDNNTELDQFEALVRNRHSIRGFRGQRVEAVQLQRVFEIARWSPSGTNVQPWHICVASGDICESLRQAFLQRFDEGVPAQPDHPGDARTDRAPLSETTVFRG